MRATAFTAALAKIYGDAIERSAAGPVRVLAADASDDPVSTEIALGGDYAPPVRFGDLVPRLERLRWVQSTAAGIGDLASPELVASGIYMTHNARAYGALHSRARPCGDRHACPQPAWAARGATATSRM